MRGTIFVPRDSPTVTKSIRCSLLHITALLIGFEKSVKKVLRQKILLDTSFCLSHIFLVITYMYSDLFRHAQMRCTLTASVGIDIRFQLFCSQQLAWFQYNTLAIYPFQFHGLSYKLVLGQRADDNAHPDCTL